jgi:precorrin-6B methylase 2
VFNRSPGARAVVLADTLELKSELAQLLSGSIPTEYTILEPEYIELNVSHNRKLGRHHAMKADNPVAILAFRFGRRPGA